MRMRMRKNTVPLHFSLLSPAVPAPAFSDPLQVQLSPPSDFPSQPSQLQDLHRLIRHDLRPTTPTPLRSAALRFAFQGGKTNEEQRDQKISNKSSKQSDTGGVAEDDNGVVKLQIPLPLSNQITTEGVGVTTPGRWCEGEKAMPLKKRKASLEMNGVVTGGYNCKMKSMTNKNCPSKKEEEDDDDDYEEDDNSSDDSDAKRNKKKKKTKRRKKKGGGRVMEGSRCSRVNGRGWRCMQPTLVGYSLCEHHLGKGRLRSINNSTVRSRPVVKLPAPISRKFIDDDDDDDTDVDEGDDRKQIPAVAGGGNGRKRTRIGMVKARSLSSLLCQPNTAFGASST